MKICAHCLRELLVDCFNRNAKAPDGLQSWCRDCKRTYARKWLRNASPTTIARHRKLKKARRVRYREQEGAKHKEWLAANLDRSRGYDAKRRQTAQRRAWAAAYWEAWKAAHPEKVREYARRGQQARRARLAEAFVERVDHGVVFARDGGICGICHSAVDASDWHLDHIEPLALGGEHSYANVRVTHPKCNIARSRGTRDEKARREAVTV